MRKKSRLFFTKAFLIGTLGISLFAFPYAARAEELSPSVELAEAGPEETEVVLSSVQPVSQTSSSVVGVITAYKFSDGSMDIWASGSGTVVADGVVAAPLSILPSADAAAYKKAADNKQASYNRFAIDLSDESMMRSLSLYIIKSDGTSHTGVVQNMANGVAIIRADGVSKPSSTDSADGTAVLRGYTAGTLAQIGDKLTANSTASGAAQTHVTGTLDGTSFTASEALDSGLIGSGIFSSEDKLYGFVTSIRGKTAQIMPVSSAIALQISSSTTAAAQPSPSTEAAAETTSSATEPAQPDTPSSVPSATVTIHGYSVSLKSFGMLIGGAAALVMVLAFLILKHAKRTENHPSEEKEKEITQDEIDEELKKEKKEEAKKKRKEKKKDKDKAYGGELARENAKEKSDEEDGEAETTLLDSGEDETTLLGVNQPKAYLETSEQEKIVINKKPFSIGKARKRVNYCINDPTVSRKHCQIVETAEGYTIEDLGSTNGTFVNDAQVPAHNPVLLHDGDTVTLSEISFTFRCELQPDRK